MDHSETDIAELVSNNVPRTKSVKELSTIVRFLFENPRVPDPSYLEHWH